MNAAATKPQVTVLLSKEAETAMKVLGVAAQAITEALKA